jgi:hypothetical protein
MDEGWGHPRKGKKWHYFDRGVSLCNTWRLDNLDNLVLTEGGSGDVDDCAICARKYDKGYYREEAH